MVRREKTLKEIRIIVPDSVYQRLMKIAKEAKVSIQDIMLRAIVKTLEEFENIGRGESR